MKQSRPTESQIVNILEGSGSRCGVEDLSQHGSAKPHFTNGKPNMAE